MTAADKAALRALAEAERKRPIGIALSGRTIFSQSMTINPDAVLSLLDEVERMREALRFYSGHHAIPNDGPWGVDSRDFGAVARAALEPRA